MKRAMALNVSLTQADVDALLARIKETRLQIAKARLALAPLEAEVQRVSDAYKKAVGALLRHEIYLKMEIDRLQAEIESAAAGGEQEAFFESLSEYEPTEGSFDPLMADPDATFKDELLNHAVWVLDYDMNEDDDDLFADIQRWCDSATTSLAKILEQIPWSKVWTARNPRETLPAQYRRLAKWHEVLIGQLERLQQTDERLRGDSRYGLLLRWQEGQARWQLFIEQTRSQYHQRLFDLQADLEQTRAEWEERWRDEPR